MTFLQPGDVGCQCSRAGLDAAVAFVGVGCAHERGLGIIEKAPHIIVQRLLVALERKHVIGALVDHLLRDLALAAHRIGGDDAALERQKLQQFRHRHDLVRFVADRKLAEAEPRIDRPGAHQMQRRGLGGTLEGAPHRLPVNCHNPLAALGKPLHEADEPGVEARRVEEPEEAAERVVARNAMRQGQKFLQERPLRAAKQRHVRTCLPAAQNRAQGNHKNLVRQMAFRIARARILKLLENLLPILHGAPPSESAPFGRIPPTPLLQ